MTIQLLLALVAIGFAAQLVDGSLGMAYGVVASSLLLSFGLPPLMVGATVHAAECFTSGASAVSHHAFGNIDRGVFKRLLIPGMLGAASGALLLSLVDGKVLAPWVSGYLFLLGVSILIKAAINAPVLIRRGNLSVLGFFGGAADGAGGGGWGPIVTSNLLMRGLEFRFAVGSVSALEFFISAAASSVFLFTVGFSHLGYVAALAVGGLIAAPLGAWFVGKANPRALMFCIGALVMGLSSLTIFRSLNA